MSTEDSTRPLDGIAFEEEALLGDIEERAGGAVHFVVRRQRDSFDLIYDGGPAHASPDDWPAAEALCAEIHAYVRRLEDLFESDPVSGTDVEYTTTWIRSRKVLYVYGAREGFFLSLDPDEPIVPIVELVRSLLA